MCSVGGAGQGACKGRSIPLTVLHPSLLTPIPQHSRIAAWELWACCAICCRCAQAQDGCSCRGMESGQPTAVTPALLSRTALPSSELFRCMQVFDVHVTCMAASICIACGHKICQCNGLPKYASVMGCQWAYFANKNRSVLIPSWNSEALKGTRVCPYVLPFLCPVTWDCFVLNQPTYQYLLTPNSAYLLIGNHDESLGGGFIAARADQYS